VREWGRWAGAIISTIMVQALESMKLTFPELSPEARRDLKRSDSSWATSPGGMSYLPSAFSRSAAASADDRGPKRCPLAVVAAVT